MDEEYLVYEQDEVYTLPTCEEELTVGGKLRIVERKHGVVIEWRCGEDETNGDSDWAVINSAAVSFTHHNISDSVEISTPRRNVRPINIELIDLRSYKIGKEASLVLIQRDGTTHTALSFKSGSISCFVDVLKRYRSIKRSEKDSALYLVLDKKQANNDDQLSAMNLVPSRKGPSGSNWHPSGEDEGAGVKGGGFGRGGAVLPHQSTHHRVWGFFNNMKRDPYTTTLTTLSKFYDVVCRM